MTMTKEETHQRKWDNPNDRNGLLNVDKKSKVNKQGLSRFCVTINDLKEGDIVYGFDEETQEISKLTTKLINDTLVLKDERGFNVKFIDIIFRTEHETKKYKNAPFM